MVDRIQRQPRYAELVRERSRWTWTILGIILVVYLGFMLAIAIRPDWMQMPITTGNVVAIGWPLATGVMVLAWLMMGVYVIRANLRFEPLKETILVDATP